MPRKIRIPNSEYPIHVSARCINKEWFRLPLGQVWEIFSDYLFLIRLLYNVKIHSFVLMNNHFHLLLSTPQANLAEAMNYFMRETSRVIGFEARRINQVYGAPYHPTIIKTQHHLLCAYKYIYRNPIEAGVAARAEEYRFSTLNGLIGRSPIYIPVEIDHILFEDLESQIEWLNREPQPEHRESVRLALRKSTFAFRRGSGIGPNELDCGATY